MNRVPGFAYGVAALLIVAGIAAVETVPASSSEFQSIQERAAVDLPSAATYQNWIASAHAQIPQQANDLPAASSF